MADKYISLITPLGSSTTYLLKDKKAIENISRDGTIFTATRRDGTTFTFSLLDNDSVTGVKGDNEINYRTGNVNLTPAHIHGTSTTALFWRGDNNWSNELSGGQLKITNYSNTVTIGSGNANYMHFSNSADIPFYFNKSLWINGDLYPYGTTNTCSLGSSSKRWKSLLIGTADSYGGTTKPIYWKNGVPTELSETVGATDKPVFLSSGTITASTSTIGSGIIPIYMSSGLIKASTSTVGSGEWPVYLNSGTIAKTTYYLKSNIEDGSANHLAYYSAARTIDYTPKIYYINSLASAAEVPINMLGLRIVGGAVGNDSSSKKTTISGTTGLLSYGDGGPQIQFSTSEKLDDRTTSSALSGALIFTDHDAAATGASWHFVSNQGDWNVISKRFHARTGISIGTSLPNTSYTLYTRGIANFNIAADNAYGINGHRLNAIFEGTNHASILIATPTNNHAYGIAVNLNGNMYIGYRNNGSYTSYTGDVYSLILNKNVSFYPSSTDATNLGTTDYFWKTGYINNIYLGNKAGTANAGIYLRGSKDNPLDRIMIEFLVNTSDGYGHGIKIGNGGVTVIGAGESAHNLSVSASSETMYVLSDGAINIEAGADAIANRKGIQITTGGHVIPVHAEANNNHAQDLGTTTVRWNLVHAKSYYIEDTRSEDLTAATNDHAIRFFFSNNNMPTSAWYSGIHVRGWEGGYSSWELVGPSDNGDQRKTPLYLKTSNKNGDWGSWRAIALSNNTSAFTLNQGTANRLAYYSAAGTISLTGSNLHTDGSNLYATGGHDFITADNEFNFISDGFSSHLWFNYETVTRKNNGNVTAYVFGNGKHGELARITSGQFSGNAATATMPLGFIRRSTNATWGNQIGATVTSWDESGGGSVDWRLNNPQTGLLAIKVDGTVYINEGLYPVLALKNANGYPGFLITANTTNHSTSAYGGGWNDTGWLRTTSNGFIPYLAGGAGSGHSSLGTSSWYFKTAYIDTIYGSLTGNASSATALKDRTNSTLTYSNYGAAGLAASAITWLTCWNGYELRAISKTEMANATDSAHKWVRIGGDTMTGSLYSPDIRGNQLRMVDDWLGFYESANVGGKRYGFIKTNADRMYFRKENGVSTYHFDFNGHIYTSANICAGTTSSTTERLVHACAAAGDIYLYSQGSATGYRGIYLVAHGTGPSRGVFSVDTNNIATYLGGQLMYRTITNSTSHALALKAEFDNHKADIPRASQISYYSSAMSNGAIAMGYFLSGYDTAPYGGFFVAHYNTPRYVGILSGTYTQWRLLKGADSGAIGGTSTPIYIDSNGIAQPCTAYGSATNIRAATVNINDDTTSKLFVLGATTTGYTSIYRESSVYMQNNVLMGAAWNDYAEFRLLKENKMYATTVEPGRVVYENGDDTLSISSERLMRGCSIVSDTYGFGIGESEKAQLPIAVSGRVLAYPYENREEFKNHIGWPVCSGPNGTVSIMTEEEEMKYPSRIIGTISAVPNYEVWHGGADVIVDGRIWIKVR